MSDTDRAGGFFHALRRQWRLAAAAGLALPVIGLLFGARLPMAIFPSVIFPRLVIEADAGELPREQMLVSVTRPVEEALRGLPGAVTVRSATSRGSAEISVNFTWRTDMRDAYLRAQAALGEARVRMPPGTELSVRFMDQTVFPVLGLTVASDHLDPAALDDYARYELRPRLAALDGVARVAVEGGRRREWLVTLDPARLVANHLDLESVRRSVAESSEITVAGRVAADRKLYLAVVTGEASAGARLADIPVLRGARVVRLGELGRVEPAPAPAFEAVSVNGGPAVILDLFRQPEADTARVVAQARALLASGAVPPAIKVGVYYDQSGLVTAAKASVRDSLIAGMLMAALIIFAFVGALRPAAAAAVVIPLSVLTTVGLLGLCGETLNLMTLGGLAAGVGLVADDAIVIVEAFAHAHGDDSRDRLRSMAACLRTVLPPLAGSSLASVVVHLPLAFLDGVAGAFFKSLSLSIALMLTVSFLYSALVVPALFPERDAAAGRRDDRFDRLRRRALAALTRLHARLLAPLIRSPRLAIAGCGLLALIALAEVRLIETDFLPEMDEGGFVIDYRLPPGTSAEESGRILGKVEAILRESPEVAHFVRRTGLQTGGWLTESNSGDIAVRLKPGARRGTPEVIAELRGRIGEALPGLQTEFFQLMEDIIGDLTAVPQPVEVKLFGAELADDQRAAAEVKARLKKVAGLADVSDGIVVAGPRLRVRLKPVEAGLADVGPDRAALNLSASLEGAEAGEILSGERLLPVRLRLGPPPTRIDDFPALPVLTGAGVTRAGSIFTLETAPAEAEIGRENLATFAAATARMEGVGLSTAIARTRSALKGLPLGPGMRIELGGLYAEQRRAFQALAGVISGAALLVFAVLLAQFRSMRAAALTLFTAALSTVGVLTALLLTGTPLNLPALVGMVMIIGIVAENSIFVLHARQRARAEGFAETAALWRAGRERLRPVLMTTIAGVLALAPLAFGGGSGADLLRPLAVSVIGGFTISAPLALLILPALLSVSGESGNDLDHST